MVESKVSLSLFIQGSKRLSQQECDKNPKKNYNEYKIFISYTKGRGKNQKKIKKPLIIQTRKQELITQNINICEDAYRYMLSTPTSTRLSKVWNSMSVHEKLKHHFDLIAHDFHAESYNYEILND